MSASNTPLVSVCVPTYQHAGFIRQCLDSILLQETDFPFEIVLGEDESTDGTREICIEYAEKYPDIIRLFLRSRKDVIEIGGRPTGRYNFTETIKATRGKYIALCDGDDYWISKDKLQKQCDFLEAYPDYVLAYHDAVVVDEQGTQTAAGRLHANVQRDFTSGELQKKKWVLLLSLFFRNGLVSFPPEFFRAPNADTFLVSLLGAHGMGKYFPELKGAYRMNAGSVWNAQSALFKSIGSARTFGWMARYYRRVKDFSLAKHYKKLFEKYLRESLLNLPTNGRQPIRSLLEEHQVLLGGRSPDKVLRTKRLAMITEMEFRMKKIVKQILSGRGN